MCPGCGAALIVFELNGVEVDWCPACGGTWLDAGELEQIVVLAGAETGRLADSLARARRGERTRRRCPRCRRRLRELQAGEDEKVALDACPAGHGLWFDRGELEKVVRQAGGGAAGAVAGFFGDLFRHELGKTEERSEK